MHQQPQAGLLLARLGPKRPSKDIDRHHHAHLRDERAPGWPHPHDPVGLRQRGAPLQGCLPQTIHARQGASPGRPTRQVRAPLRRAGELYSAVCVRTTRHGQDGHLRIQRSRHRILTLRQLENLCLSFRREPTKKKL